jgi:hypothetical protein
MLSRQERLDSVYKRLLDVCEASGCFVSEDAKDRMYGLAEVLVDHEQTCRATFDAMAKTDALIRINLYFEGEDGEIVAIPDGSVVCRESESVAAMEKLYEDRWDTRIHAAAKYLQSEPSEEEEKAYAARQTDDA